jgi:NAD(P)-dependent dehydrogenase (short-subunit alcohol dehydrogenase family)
MSEPDSEAYAASKGGIVALTHALAASFAPDHIRVNCISPGWIETGDYSKLRDTDHSQHLSGRVGKPDDIARACLYLTEDGNDFVNGTNLIIDGGMTRKMIYEE